MIEIDMVSLGINIAMFFGVIFVIAFIIVIIAKRGNKSDDNDDRNMIMFGDMDKMSGVDFEKLLGLLLARKGYSVKFTPKTGDFGADLILTHDLKRIAVQAKRSKSAVGNSSVQEALAGAHYYNCAEAWVITNNAFTPGGIKQAQSCNVKLFDRQSVLDMQSEVRQVIEAEERGTISQSGQQTINDEERKKYGILNGGASMENCSGEKQEQSLASVHYGTKYISDAYDNPKKQKKSKIKHKPSFAISYNIDECKAPM